MSKKIVSKLEDYYIKMGSPEKDSLNSNKLTNLFNKIQALNYKEKKLSEDEIFSIFEDKLFYILLENMIENYSEINQ